MSLNMWWGLIIALALVAGLLIPYLVEEISRGKVELGPRVPTGAGDTRPGSRGNPAPGQPVSQPWTEGETVSLGSFHTVVIWLSTVLAAGTGLWALFNSQLLLGLLSFGAVLLLIAYASYFRDKIENAHLK